MNEQCLSVGLCLRPLRELGQPAARLESHPGDDRHGVEPKEVAVEEVDDGVASEDTADRLSSVILAVVAVSQLEINRFSRLIFLHSGLFSLC